MSAIRQQGKINQSTTLIDIGMYGVAGTGAVYLVRGLKTCLIDAGTRTTAKALVRTLRGMGCFPPDMIIVTHSHYDHTQGIPQLRREAAKLGKSIEVLASEKAISLLKDQSWNRIFGPGPYEGIQDVTPLKENDVVDLGDIKLRVYDVPGHSADHIALADESSRNIFIGDAIGDKIADLTFLPPFNPPLWDPDSFHASVDKLKRLDYSSLCFAHFGCIYGAEAKQIPDEAVSTCETWWQLFSRHADRLGDTSLIRDAVMSEIKPGVPELKIQSIKLKVLFAMMTNWRRLTGKPHLPVGLLLFSGVIKDLASGYKMYVEQQKAHVRESKPSIS